MSSARSTNMYMDPQRVRIHSSSCKGVKFSSLQTLIKYFLAWGELQIYMALVRGEDSTSIIAYLVNQSK